MIWSQEEQMILKSWSKSRWFIGCRKSLYISETSCENSLWRRPWCLEKRWRQSTQRSIEGKMTKYYHWWHQHKLRRTKRLLTDNLGKIRHETSQDICPDIVIKKKQNKNNLSSKWFLCHYFSKCGINYSIHQSK